MFATNTIASRARSVLLAAGLAAALAAPATAQTDFTYQGVLSENGSPVDGTESIRFRLYDAPTGGTLFGETTQNVDVADGVFTAPLNLGTLNTIDPESAWLEVAVNTGPGTFDVLGRQKITAAPFSMNTRGIDVNPAGRVGIGAEATDSTLTLVSPVGVVGMLELLTNNGGDIRYDGGTDGDFFIEHSGDVDASTIFGRTGGQRLLKIQNDGNIGIGTDNPGSLLHVSDNDAVGASAEDASNVLIASTDAALSLASTQQGSVGSAIYLVEENGSGNQVDNWTIRRRTPTADSRLEFAFGNGFGSSNPTKMAMLPDGRVGIGTESPAAALDVNTSGNFLGIQSRGTSAAFSLDNTSDANTRWTVFADSTDVLNIRDTFDGRTVARVVRAPQHEINLMSSTSGNVRAVMGDSLNRSDNGRIFTVDETNTIKTIIDVEADGTGFVLTDLYFTTSDERLKENIETLVDPLETVRSLRGVTYDRKDGTSYGEVGFIAQEVEEVLPQLVNTNGEGMKSVAYDRMTAVLIEAVKAQQAEIDALKAGRTVFNSSLTWPMAALIGVGGIAAVRHRTAKD